MEEVTQNFDTNFGLVTRERTPQAPPIRAFSGFQYLNPTRLIEGLSIAPHNELLLKMAFHKCQSYYYPTDNPVKIAKALAKSSPTAANLARLAKVLDSQNQSELAVSLFEQALLTAPDSNEALFEIYKSLGNAYLKLGDFESAEENYNKAFTLAPHSSILHINLGTLAIQKNEWHKVQHHFREALRLDPSQDKAWTGLAIYHNYMGDRDLALANLKKSLDLSPSNRVAILLLVNWSPSQSSLEALDRLIKYISLNPLDQEMSLLLIQVASSIQQIEIAKIEATRLILLDPNNQQYQQVHQQLFGSQHE